MYKIKSNSSKTITIPTIDISQEKYRHVIIAKGTEDIYQGHPTTLLMPDGRTMYCVWTIGHGGSCGPMKRSEDGGLTWSELLNVPDNWKEVFNCPSIYRLVDSKGIERLMIFAGGPKTMRQTISMDQGKSWTEYIDLGIDCVMGFCTILPVDSGNKHLALFHRREDIEGESSLIICKSESLDGGMTWGEPEVICRISKAKPCEPELIRSPDGKQLLCIMRENSREFNSLMITSDDEGVTWSEPRELSASLTGDRHKAVYLNDGRIVIAMRDKAKESQTRGCFIAWVGTYDDIVNCREGQYRVKLLHSYEGSDCGYPGLELLPDNTIVATTYIKYTDGIEKHSVVSTRFNIDELDQRL